MATMRRVYLALNTGDLDGLRASRELAGEQFSGFGVTDAVRAEQPGTDDDEVHEYRACQDAARAGLAAGGSVVAAADVAASEVTEVGSEKGSEKGSGSALSVRGPLPLKRFASFHLIDREAASQDPDADVELSWFDSTELDLLLEVLNALS